MFDNIINLALVGVQDEVKKALAAELKGVAEEFVTKNVIDRIARLMLKGIDTVVEKSVHLLTSDQVAKLAGTYTDEIDRQFVQLNQVVAAYVPLQVAVEMAKKQHGKNSPEANAARALRTAGIAGVKAQFGDVFASIIGGHVTD